MQIRLVDFAFSQASTKYQWFFIHKIFQFYNKQIPIESF